MTRPRRRSPASSDIPQGTPPRITKPETAAPRMPRKAPSGKAASHDPTADQPSQDPLARGSRRRSRAVGDEAAPWPDDAFVFDADPVLPDDFRSGGWSEHPLINRPDAALSPVGQPGAVVPGAAAQEIARIREGMWQIRQLIDGPMRKGDGAWVLLQSLCHDPLPRRRANATTAMARLMAFPPSTLAPQAGVAPPATLRASNDGGRPTQHRRADDRQVFPKIAEGQAPDNALAGTEDPQSVGLTPGGHNVDQWPVQRLILPPMAPDQRWPGAGAADLPEMRIAATTLPGQSMAQGTTRWPDIRDPVATAGGAPLTSKGRSRVLRLMTAWADWLLWRLQPPRIPQVDYQEVVPDKPALAPVDRVFWPVRSDAPCIDASQGAALPEEAMQPSSPEGPASPNDADAGNCPQDPAPETVAPIPSRSDDAIEQALTQALRHETLRDHLQQMIRDELAGEMGARFSGNLQAVIRREVAAGLDDRLTHL